MLIEFFYHLRDCRLPVTLREFFDLLEAMKRRVVWGSVDEFYFLARICLVKNEEHFDRFDRAFAAYFEGNMGAWEALEADIPEEWLRKQLEKHLSEAEKAKLEEKGWDELLEMFKERMKEQNGAHHGGSKWIGTGGTSPFGAYGYNPAGYRVGQDGSRNRRAIKVWDKREFRNLDDSVELGTRNIKVALRRLRRFARSGAAEELDLDDTIRSTARNAGLLDLKMVPERHNAVKVILMLDVGGSMDDHVRVCEELFSAARAEFKHLEQYYFHNCVYESVWRDNGARNWERVNTEDLIHTYPSDYKLVFVGDATMSPYEITQTGGSVEHWNAEPGAAWIQRLTEAFPHHVWINPQSEPQWDYHPSIRMLNQLMTGDMYPLTLDGLEQGIRRLAR
jgi:uncharacterized protein with von Willebrand factor type A (vWA) domain